MRAFMRRRAFADWSGIALGVAVVVVAGTLAVADELSPAKCCFTYDECPGQGNPTHCISACASNKVCSGHGGCTPHPWAEALCIDRPVGP